MSDVVLKIEGLYKQYRLGVIGATTLRSDVSRLWANIRGKEDPTTRIESKASNALVWALQDINFEVRQGEIVGIIGKNGAGKSTLLKILSKVTAQTKGEVKIKGRISSLLEVGTGFHPELTGRENIYLNGAILGMTKAEVSKKLEEIIDFSGVEKYIDTPVKRYSSGMYVRLAFAVAAHLEPEILIVDEVLAVGDAEFQKKCLGKMKDVSQGGRTVLFVSHNLGAINHICNKGILLKSGKLILADKISPVIDKYLNTDIEISSVINNNNLNSENVFKHVSMTDNLGKIKNEYKYNDKIYAIAELYLPNYNENLELAMRLIDRQKRPVFTIHEKLNKYYKSNPLIKLQIEIPEKFLTPGMFSWTICINRPGVSIYDLHEDVLSFTMQETGSDFSSYNSFDYGCVFGKFEVTQLT